MTLGSWTYYDRAVTRSLDGYYLAAGEEAGHWIGRGSAELGLSGEATSEGLARLFDAGCHPVTGDQLGCGLPMWRDGRRSPASRCPSHHPSRCRCCGDSVLPRLPPRCAKPT